MKNHWKYIVATVAAFAFGQVSAHGENYGSGYGNGYSNSRTLQCESVHQQRTFCRANTQGRVRLIRQLSQSSCIRGRTWGYNRSGVWVSRGCRAQFAVGSSYGNNNNYGNTPVRDDHYVDSSGRLIHCESTANGRTYCGTHHDSYEMSGNRDPNCIQGQTWGYDNRGVWVSGDCDANFSYNDNAPVRDDHYIDASGQLIHCESTASGRTYCGTHHDSYEMSGNADPNCIQGQTWGYDDRGVWVSGDCDANFSYDDHDGDHHH